MLQGGGYNCVVDGGATSLEGQKIWLRPVDRDRYGRLLRLVLVDGRSAGDVLVGEGLARWYGAHRRPWC